METLAVLDKFNVKNHLNCYFYMLNNKGIILRSTSGIPISGIQTIMKAKPYLRLRLSDIK